MMASTGIRNVSTALLLMGPAAAALSCDLRYSNDDLTEVRVSYKFADRSFQTDWAYRSLEPVLTMGEATLRPRHVESADGALVSVFCLSDKQRADLGPSWVFATGTRRFSIVPRPTAKVDTKTSSFSKKDVSLYRMPDIPLVDAAAPDWVILRSARWQRTNDGALRLDVEFVNPTAQTFAGADVSLAFVRPKTIACMAGPDYREPSPVPVEIRVQSGAIRVASGDPQYGELIRRDASYKVEGCFQSAWVRMSIGPSVPVPSGQTARTRYAVRYVKSAAKAGDAGRTDDLPADFLNWQAELSISGNEVRPRNLVVEPAAR